MNEAKIRTEKWQPPKVIYLQVGEDFDPYWDDPDLIGGEVSWCVDKIFDTDIEYRLAILFRLVKNETE